MQSSTASLFHHLQPLWTDFHNWVCVCVCFFLTELSMYLCWSFCCDSKQRCCCSFSFVDHDHDDGILESSIIGSEVASSVFFYCIFFLLFFYPKVWNLWEFWAWKVLCKSFMERWGLGIMQFRLGVWMWESQREGCKRMVLRRKLGAVLNSVSLGAVYLQDQRWITP